MSKCHSSSEAVYGLGLIGSLVFYVQQSSGVGGFLLAVFKSIVWPAFMAYDLFKFLH